MWYMQISLQKLSHRCYNLHWFDYQWSWLCFLLINNLCFIICEFFLCIIFLKFNWYFAELPLTMEFSLFISAKHIGHFNADLYVLVLLASRHFNSSWAKLKSIILRNSWLLNRVKTNLNKKFWLNESWARHLYTHYFSICVIFKFDKYVGCVLSKLLVYIRNIAQHRTGWYELIHSIYFIFSLGGPGVGTL